MEAGKSVAEVSREHQLHPTQLDQWRRALRRYGERVFAGNGRAYSDEARMAALERKIGQLTMENDLLKKDLSALETRDPVQSGVKKNDERAGPQTGRSIRRRADHSVVWGGGFGMLDVLLSCARVAANRLIGTARPGGRWCGSAANGRPTAVGA